MEPTFTTEVFRVIKDISIPGAIVAVALILRPFIPVLLSKIRTKNGENANGNTVSQQIKELMAFKELAETNHYSDLSRLIESDKEQWKAINKIQEDIKKQGEDVAYIRGQLNKNI